METSKTQLMILVVIFGKRQIARFKFKSGNIPHIDIGTGLPKILKAEIKSRLQRVMKIKYEPILVNDSILSSIEKQFPNGGVIRKRHGSRYEASIDLQDFLFAQARRLHLDDGLVKSFVCQYNHARYGHAKFDSDSLKEYRKTLSDLIENVNKVPVHPGDCEVIYTGDGTTGQLKQNA